MPDNVTIDPDAVWQGPGIYVISYLSGGEVQTSFYTDGEFRRYVKQCVNVSGLRFVTTIKR